MTTQPTPTAICAHCEHCRPSTVDPRPDFWRCAVGDMESRVSPLTGMVEIAPRPYCVIKNTDGDCKDFRDKEQAVVA